MDVVVDSGAATSAIPTSLAKGHQVGRTSGRPTYTSASGQAVQVKGEVTPVLQYQTGGTQSATFK
eukprot:12900245-Prorocentrum_lima.AAC.1